MRIQKLAFDSHMAAIFQVNFQPLLTAGTFARRAADLVLFFATAAAILLCRRRPAHEELRIRGGRRSCELRPPLGIRHQPFDADRAIQIEWISSSSPSISECLGLRGATWA